MSQSSSIGDFSLGRGMLERMGWNAGQGLGKHGEGRIAPLCGTQRHGTHAKVISLKENEVIQKKRKLETSSDINFVKIPDVIFFLFFALVGTK